MTAAVDTAKISVADASTVRQIGELLADAFFDDRSRAGSSVT
jgi:hypothetical protein